MHASSKKRRRGRKEHIMVTHNSFIMMPHAVALAWLLAWSVVGGELLRGIYMFRKVGAPEFRKKGEREEEGKDC